ncbi:MAG: type II secretion system F family protein [Candidatus Berkelbacteria bacterium]
MVEKKLEKKTTQNKLSFFTNLMIGEEKDFFIENLSVLLASGMPIVAALQSLKEEVRSGALKKIITELLDDIASGATLWRSMEKAGIFQKHFISLIRIGEQSGRLSENLKIVAQSQSKDKMFRSKIRSAMAYPLFVFFLILFVGSGVTWFILPKLSTVFSQLHVKLPKITIALISFGNFLRADGLIFVPSFLGGLLLLVYFIFFFPSTKFIGQAIIFAIPATRGILLQSELSRSGYILGSLIDAGMPIVEALDALADSSTITAYTKFYTAVSKTISEGNSFQKSFASYKGSAKLMPKTIQQMIIVSEQSGSLSETLIRIGQMYEEKADVSAKNLATILEPVFLVIVWLGVLFVALSVIMPIYGLVGGMNSAIQ